MKYNKLIFITLLVEGKLWQYLADIDTQAQQMFDTIVEQIKEAEVITEKLKEKNQLDWVCRMENIMTRAKEFICNELL